MLEIRSKSSASVTRGLSLTLPFQDRQRSRLRVELSNGQEALLLMPRGSVLRGGDRLALSDGRVVLVLAAPEQVSTVRTSEAQALARAAYHLGNRHIPLEVGEGLVRYLHDHVLDGMVRALGLVVVVEQAPFEPESGAYGRRGHAHGHSQEEGSGASGHGHGHAYDTPGPHAHDHEHTQPHEHGGVVGVRRAVEMVRLGEAPGVGAAGARGGEGAR
jgi:urease accessory protein